MSHRVSYGTEGSGCGVVLAALIIGAVALGLLVWIGLR